MRNLWRMLVTLALAAVGLVQPVQAVPVTGQDDPAFEAAVADWLAGREEPAIRALGQLAQGGNPAAQILLGLLDTTPAYQGDWQAALPRAERLKVLRAPGGLSGRSWMLAAAASEPLAQAWLRLWDGDADVAVVLDFARLGEARAAHMAARQLFTREKCCFAALAEDPAFPSFLMPLAIREWQASDPARARAALATLAPGDPGLRLFAAGPPEPADLLAWAENAPQGQRLLPILAAICPGSTSKAADLAAYLAQSGGYWGLAWIGPPSETLIDPDRYGASPQAARTALNLLRAGPLAGPEVLAASPCLASLLAARAKASGPKE